MSHFRSHSCKYGMSLVNVIVYLAPCYSICGPRSSSPGGCLLEMQTLRTHPRPTGITLHSHKIDLEPLCCFSPPLRRLSCLKSQLASLVIRTSSLHLYRRNLSAQRQCGDSSRVTRRYVALDLLALLSHKRL